MSMIGEDKIILSTSQAGEAIYQQLKEKSSFFTTYKFVRVSSDAAANLLAINDSLVYTPTEQPAYANLDEFKSAKSLWPVDVSEFAKIDGLLTCKSVLFSSGHRK
jgi:N-dimethylarginine dimethylaminohydrolase